MQLVIILSAFPYIIIAIVFTDFCGLRRNTIRDIDGPAAPKQLLDFEVIYFIDAFDRQHVFDFGMCKKWEV